MGTLQWAGSFTRMTESLGSIFEGQRLATMRCSNCDRTGLSGAEPFSIEEVKLAAHAQDEGFISRLSAALFSATETRFSLKYLLMQGAESPAQEGYRCPNERCATIGCSLMAAAVPSLLTLNPP